MLNHSLVACVVVACVTTVSSAADKVDFTKDIAPILQAHCTGCHNADDAEGKFASDSHDALIKGGESGVAITAGQPNSSRLLMMVTGKMEPAMPPEGETPLNEKQIATITTWIEQGAVGPSGSAPMIRELRTPKIPAGSGIKEPITAMAMSADGSLRAEARFSKVIIRRGDDVVTTIAELPGKVNSLQFSADGQRLLVGSGLTGAFGQASLYRVSDGSNLKELVGHRDILYRAVFSPNEKLIATAGYDRVINLWDAATGKVVRELKGHNGAVFDLAFSPGGKVLVSGCADETAKVWNVKTGERLDTLGQPEGEVFAVAITPSGKHIVAGSADNRIRVWDLVSLDKPKINPIVATRFVDESPIVNFRLTPSGDGMVVISESGNVKLLRTSDWNQAADLQTLSDTGSDLLISPDGKTVTVALLDGSFQQRTLPTLNTADTTDTIESDPIYLDLEELVTTTEAELRKQIPIKDAAAKATISVGRGVQVTGSINEAGESDRYQWRANKGEVWAIDADRMAKQAIDPLVAILDASGKPVLRTRLQAVRDSYFTFRGKNSEQVTDFRIFNWQEMHLSQYLYANGEVTKLWMHPRGPDSGFNVFPGEGKRWTYFGTTHTAHALGEPAYIVEPLDLGTEPIANGLPVFDIYYENDDDPTRRSGTASRLVFHTPADGIYTVSVTDTRGNGDTKNFQYTLKIRAAEPDFKASVSPANGTLRKGTGREFIVRADRFDEFDGPVNFQIPDLPPQIKSNMPLTIESGQRFAVGNLWVAEDTEAWEGKLEPELVAWAMINGKRVERKVGKVGSLTLGDIPNVIPSIQPIDRETAASEDWTLKVRRGETATARLVIRRKKGFAKEVNFGKEDSGRNVSQGVYVDNIGLSGLLVLKGATERQFYLTADISAVPGKRSFFFRAKVDGNVTSYPITVEVLP